MDRLQELGLGGSLLLFDRWYPSAAFLANTLDAGSSFVMRVRKKWNFWVYAVKTEVNVFQDFYATVYLTDFAAICAAETDERIAFNDKSKNLKYSRKSSQNRTIAKLRDRFWRILLEDDPVLRDLLMERLCTDIAARPESVRPDHSPTRKSPRKKRFHVAQKSVLP